MIALLCPLLLASACLLLAWIDVRQSTSRTGSIPPSRFSALSAPR
jgi:hypothetical protein